MDATHGGIQLLPHDVILDILRRRLPLRALVNSRRVCRAWRAAIDDTTLLLTHFCQLFPPHAFPGIFTSNDECDGEESSFFAPVPSSKLRRDTDGDGFRYPLFEHGWASVKDHCNGLLLLCENFTENCYCVCNPATVRCARLPSPPMLLDSLMGCFTEGVFLAFDPAMSRHHEVFLFPETITQLRPGMEEEAQPCVQVQRPRMKNLRLWRLFEEDQPFDDDEEDDDEEEGQVEVEPPEPAAEEPRDEVLSLVVFSSRTNEWECRDFLPRHCTPEHLYDVLDKDYGQIWKSATYWQGSLYVHCHKNILLILRNSQGTYDMVQLPGIPLEQEERTGTDELPTRSVLGSYEKGIHYVAFDRFQLQVWELKEPADGQLEWMLTHKADLSPYVHSMNESSLPTQSMVPWKPVKRNRAKLSLFEPLSDTEQRYLEFFNERWYGPGGRRTTTRRVKKDPRYSWDSDEDNFIDMDAHLDPPPWYIYGHCRIIGLHPHKDVLLLRISGKALAYHLSTSRMQFLGKELVRNALHTCYGVKLAFPYRPCYVDALLTTKMSRGRKHNLLF